jgi:enhancing lycopene biosynthesis protein 2
MKLNVGNKVTRLEVIDSLGGREYVNLHVDDLILDFQDNGRTGT